jgi:hypothetical protein
LERSGVAEILESWMPQVGRPREVSAKAVLLGMLVAIDEGRVAHLVAGHDALGELESPIRKRLRATRVGASDLRGVTYRQFTNTHKVMIDTIDPSPCPSFKGVAQEDRLAHLEGRRSNVDQSVATLRLEMVTDALIDASVPDNYKQVSSSVAIDWTDHETWSRPRNKDDPQPANDPDASWGHAKRNAPGAVDHLFFGYYAQVATMVKDERGPKVPELVRAVAFKAPKADPAVTMAKTLLRRSAKGMVFRDVIADCGYSNRNPDNFARLIRQAGGDLTIDIHPEDRGPKGTYKGAVVSNGNLYCPCTPRSLLELGPLKRSSDTREADLHDERCHELGAYKLGRVSRNNEAGDHRVMCPALLGKLRCPLRQKSMSLDFGRPEVFEPPSYPPACCVQQTITVKEQVTAKTAQRHDYPSKAHRLSYRRRTASERTFAWLSDPATVGIRRGWSRLMGETKNRLMYVLGVVVRNVRIVESFERAKAKEAKEEAKKLRRPRGLSRRHQEDECTRMQSADSPPIRPG